VTGAAAGLPTGLRLWVAGARPRTLASAVVPVVVGLACAVGKGGIVWWRFVAALVVSVALQVGTNYANDYSDGVRGTDTARVGPIRLVASGLASAGAVKRAAFLAFGVAALAGALLALAVGPQLLLVGAAAIAAGWFYTGGPKPYGYYGYGEAFVFVFFGVVATAGTTYVLVEHLTGLALAAGAAVGCVTCSLLVVNNLRDIPTDREAGKRTLAVRMGDRWTRRFYTTLVVAAFVIALLCVRARWPVVLTLLAVPAAVVPVRQIRNGASGRELIAVLGATARLQLSFGAAFALGLALGG
jgi:1,4-dihydroxy-2-naphthoate octaprenyltransferase